MGVDNWRSQTSWLIGIKYPTQITLCDTNTVIVLIIVIIVDP